MFDELFKDEKYLRLRSKLNSPNIFLCLDNASYEIRHSNFISWLLNPDGSHNLNDYFLRLFLDSIGQPAAEKGELLKILREKWNIDILIEFKSRVIVIENKIKAKDSSGQLFKYRTKIRDKFPSKKINLIYWTLNGSDPTDIDEGEEWGRYSYEKFADILEDSLSDIKEKKVAIYIEDYVDALRLRYLKQSKYIEIAKKINEKYKMEISKLFEDQENFNFEDKLAIEFLKNNSDFVKGNGFFSNERPYFLAFKNACESNNYEVTLKGKKQSTYFSFVPAKLDKNLKRFEFSFRFYEKNNTLRIFYGVSPETNENKKMRDSLLNNVCKFENLKFLELINARGKKHIGLVKKDIAFNPLVIDQQKIDIVVGKIFVSEVNNFVDSVIEVVKNIQSIADEK